MESEQTIGMEEMEKEQRNIQKNLSQMMKRMTSLMIEKRITEDPHLQEGPLYKKNDIGEWNHPCPPIFPHT